MAESSSSMIVALTSYFLLLITALLCICTSSHGSGGLSPGFYSKTCPDVETIVSKAVVKKCSEIPTARANALRILIHDCFVEGCDASVMISSNGTYSSERDAEINLSLAQDGFDLFLEAKAAVEVRCPGIVSCADIMTMATRDAVYLLGGPRFEVQTGRRDGIISMASRVPGNLPVSNQTLPQLIQLFQSKGLTVEDLVILSGAHSVGAAHCVEFMQTLYRFNQTYNTNPSMDMDYAARLRGSCPETGFNPELMIYNDGTTPYILDNHYYENLKKGMGLLATDQALYSSQETRDLVNAMARDEKGFQKRFGEAMNKMSAIGVKTGSEGEIRRDCRVPNSVIT